jgi:hypothetical protein
MAGLMFWTDEVVDVSDEAAKFGTPNTVFEACFMVVTVQPVIHATLKL